MTEARRQRLWRGTEIAITLAVVLAVGWQFAGLLRSPELWSQPLHLDPAWLAASAVLYLLGITTSGLFWHQLLLGLGQKPTSLLATLRAYYVGQMGRYVPGKVVGVLWRSRLLRGPEVHGGVAALTVVYEALTTLASASILGGLVLGWEDMMQGDLGWKTWGLVALVGLPLLPGVFNRLVDRSTRRWRQDPDTPLPPVRAYTLLVGLVLTGSGWLIQGASLMALTEAVFPGSLAWSVPGLFRYAAYTGLAYAIGFVVLVVPGGLGVREFFLQRFLSQELAGSLAGGAAALMSLLSRLLWTVMDVLIAVISWHLCTPRRVGRAERDPPLSTAVHSRCPARVVSLPQRYR